MQPGQDNRSAIYEGLHKGQLEAERQGSLYSANRVLSQFLEHVPAHSVVDIGCGIGTWLAAAKELGLEIAGVEGPWLNLEHLDVDRDVITITDLEKPIDIGRKFDLAISIEVGEHLSDAAAPNLVESLTRHSDFVIFSAAVPFQGGDHHINEQYLGYWIAKFDAAGYQVVDLFRGHLWNDQKVHFWVRQNAVLFVNRAVLDSHPDLKAESEVVRPLDIIHPQNYEQRIRLLSGEMQRLQEALIQMGYMRLVQTPNGPAYQLRPPGNRP